MVNTRWPFLNATKNIKKPTLQPRLSLWYHNSSNLSVKWHQSMPQWTPEALHCLPFCDFVPLILRGQKSRPFCSTFGQLWAGAGGRGVVCLKLQTLRIWKLIQHAQLPLKGVRRIDRRRLRRVIAAPPHNPSENHLKFPS